MFSWAEEARKGYRSTLSRQQLALVVALFDEAENLYLSSGRSMRHLLLDADFASNKIRSVLLHECVQVRAA